MCGRYTLKKTTAELSDHFGVEVLGAERYNVAPSQSVPAVLFDAVRDLKWGFIPSWSKEPKAGFSNINARAETVAKSAAYRGSFRKRRCLLPADGFYEWAPGPPKVPHHFRLKGGGPFAFAGLWDRWGEDLETCALITSPANAVVGPVHNRMPVILGPDDYQVWLDPLATPNDLQALLRPYDPDLMEGFAVGKAVNKPSNNGPECIEAA